MNRLSSLLFLAIAPFPALSCSSILAEGGTKLEPVFQETSTRSSIHAVLGQPISAAAFRPARTVRQIPDLASQRRLQWATSAATVPLAGYEDFHFKGWVYQPSDANGAVFIDTITFGFGGLIGAPGYILLQKSRTHDYRVYYDSSGHYFGHLVIADSRYSGRPPLLSLRGDPCPNL